MDDWVGIDNSKKCLKLKREISTHPVGLFEAAVVGDVLALGHPTINVKLNVIQFIFGVLINDALGSLPEGLNRGVVPPLH